MVKPAKGSVLVFKAGTRENRLHEKVVEMTDTALFDNPENIESAREGETSYQTRTDHLANALVVLRSTAEDGEIEVRISVGFRLEPHYEDTDEFHVLRNGSLSVPYLYPDYYLTPHNYCLETFYVTELEGEIVLPLVCFEDSSTVEEPFSIHLILYPIGLLISVPFLVSTMLVYCLIPQLRDLHGKTLSCHVMCLAAAYVLLAIVQLGGRDLNDHLCTVIEGLEKQQHYIIDGKPPTPNTPSPVHQDKIIASTAMSPVFQTIRERVRNHPQYLRPVLNHDLPVISSLFYYESDALDDVVTKAAFLTQFTFQACFFWLQVMCFDTLWVISSSYINKTSIQLKPYIENKAKEMAGIDNETFDDVDNSLEMKNVFCLPTLMVGGKLPSKSTERRVFLCYSIYAWCWPIILIIVSTMIDLIPTIPSSYIKPNFGHPKKQN
uniref:Uncharacterized protein n=1 Tax=Timema monikensis TaxID=170555 RepID=A0A7R9E8H4_9NEOP|nr:unnamed protein product [Timema monikensis]